MEHTFEEAKGVNGYPSSKATSENNRMWVDGR
jgi:hypothetical protein